MKKITLRTALIAAALLCGANAWADTAPATVKMTYVNFNDPDVSYGEIASGSEAITGFNKFSNGTVGFQNTGWGVNYITFIQIDASSIDGTITGASLSIDASGSRDSRRTQCIAVGYNSSTWSSSMTYNTCTPTGVTQLDENKLTSSTSAGTFNTLTYDISAALVGNDDKIVTILVFSNDTKNSAGGCNIKNPSVTVTYTPAGATPTTYTIKYVDQADGSTIKTSSPIADAVGNSVSATSEQKADFTEGENKYTYVSGGETPLVLSATAASNVIELTFRKLAVYSYSVVASTGAEIASGSGYEGTSVNYGYPKYQLVGTTLYSTTKQSSNPWWGKSFTLDENGKTETVTYSADKTNVVFYKEAETIEGMTATSASNANIRCSNQSGAYTPANVNVVVTELPAGVYKLYTSVWGNAGTKFAFLADGDTIHTTTTAGYIVDSEAEFTLTKTTSITVTGGNKDKCVDYIVIEKTADYTESVEISSIGYSTYSSANALDFTGIDGLKAYIASENNEGEITFTPVEKVAGGQGLLLAGTAGQSYDVKAIAEADAPTTNYLVAATEDIDALESDTDGKLNYILNNVDGNTGFYAAAGKKVAKGKAYLQLPAAAAAKAFIPFNFGQANAIEAVSTVAQPADSRIYNLSGQRLSSLQKGLNIVNGKKIYVK